MKKFKKSLLLSTVALTLVNATYPAIVSAKELTPSETETVDTTILTSGQFVGEDGNIYTEEDFIVALNNRNAMIIEVGKGWSNGTNSSIQTMSVTAGALGGFIGSTIVLPGIGQVVVTVGGLAIGGIVVYKAGSWAWNKAKAFMANEANWTADQIISKKRKGSIRREFPSEYLGKTLKQINQDAKKGNARARKAKKLLQDGRFKK